MSVKCKFEQVRDALLGEIKKGAYKKDLKLPSESELVERFGVARASAVRAKIRATAFRDGYFRDQALRNAAGQLEFVKDTTEVAQYFAFFTGVATKESHPALWRKMIDGFGPGKTSDGLFPANILPGFMLRMELLARDGQTDRLASEIKSYLLPMANLTGTIWEFAEGIDSHCHAFGSYACVYILRDILKEKPLKLEVFR